jgi:nucleotide-binding universal stress UspA family protein
MAKRILLPLDQSPTAEDAVPLVADAARGGGASVRLLHVAALPGNLTDEAGRVIAFADQEMARLETEALDYLRTVEARLEGVPVDCVVRFGDPAEEILREVDDFGADLVVVTTAAGSGLKRMAFGSVAEEVFRKARVRVALLHGGCG